MTASSRGVIGGGIILEVDLGFAAAGETAEVGRMRMKAGKEGLIFDESTCYLSVCCFANDMPGLTTGRGRMRVK